MQTAHTPGPWTQYRGTVYVEEIGTIAKMDDSLSQRDANARLIAAAPDLLAALQDFVWRGKDMEAMGIDSGDIAKARAAIAKAIGP